MSIKICAFQDELSMLSVIQKINNFENIFRPSKSIKSIKINKRESKSKSESESESESKNKKSTKTRKVKSLNNESFVEPMLKPDINRFTLFPIKREDLWIAYKKHKLTDWTAEELDYSSDKEEFKKLSTDEKYFIKNILAFFAGADGIVLENIDTNFGSGH